MDPIPEHPAASNVDALTRAPDALERAPYVFLRDRQHHPRLCASLTRKGRPCQMFALTGEIFCMNHTETADTHAAASRAARASVISRTMPSGDLINTAFSFTDRASIQAVVDSTFRLILSGRLDADRARLALRACSIAVQNFDRSRDTISGPVPQQHDWFPYFEKVRSLLASVDPLLARPTPADDPEDNPFTDPHPARIVNPES